MNGYWIDIEVLKSNKLSLTTMKGDHWDIYPSAETNGNWRKVKVTQFESEMVVYSPDSNQIS